MATLKSLSTEKEASSSQPDKDRSNVSKNISTVSASSNNPEDTSVESMRKRKLLKIAPKLPFDIDLYHWEDKDLKAPSVEM